MCVNRCRIGGADPRISRFDRGKFSYESRGHAAWGLVQDHQAEYRVADVLTPETVELASTADKNTLVAYGMNGAPLPHWRQVIRIRALSQSQESETTTPIIETVANSPITSVSNNRGHSA